MCAKLHVWKGKEHDGEIAGHGGLELSGGTYISWRRNMFPDDNESQPINPTTLEDDCNFEGRAADKTFPVHASEIDEYIILRWWREWQTRREWKKQGEITPCFTVLEAIMAGRGWSRSEKGVRMDPGELVDQVARLGVITRNEGCVIQ
ncbi:uncharacterized protein LOC124138186 [Haliotis rufescens]|uniref:uncharacterized protein LOC124138186 n=1 Tax=Haliotis rufescens TaxID=6454 RepID=UPI001EAFF98D|nr:uncharacterized protein LOC124138186 [Haliotis rufescens]